MPSQSLTIVLANATVAEPQPEAVGLLKEVAKLLRHDGVKKKLERLVGAATSALAAFPERMLDFPTSEALPASLTRHYKLAVETLLSRPNAIPATEWLGRFGPSNRNGWALASQLIWQISEADGARTFAAILEGRAGRIAWRLVDDTLVPFDGDANVRMWHPVEVDAKETAIWCARIIATGVKQPFAQALRETYAPLAHELAGRQTALFAGQTVSAVPMIGLARRAGWRLGFQDELYMTLGGISFTFHAGIPAYPGSAGIGVTGSLSLNVPQDSLAKVPRRALSEVLRRVGLLVSVGATS